jgi:hypothetical protein
MRQPKSSLNKEIGPMPTNIMKRLSKGILKNPNIIPIKE